MNLKKKEKEYQLDWLGEKFSDGIISITDLVEKDNLVIDIEEPKFSTASSIMFMQDLNKYIENKIKLNPEEYLWQHRRFKSTLGKEKIYK